MTGFATHFSDTEVSVLELQQFKLAYKQIGPYTLVHDSLLIVFSFSKVLSGDKYTSNYALVQILGIAWDCFQFYHGDLSQIERLAQGDRRRLQRELSRFQHFFYSES